MTDTPDEVREKALRAVKWLKTSRAKAAPDALATIAYLAAREQILDKRLRDIARVVLSGSQPPDSVTPSPGHQDTP